MVDGGGTFDWRVGDGRNDHWEDKRNTGDEDDIDRNLDDKDAFVDVDEEVAEDVAGGVEE